MEHLNEIELNGVVYVLKSNNYKEVEAIEAFEGLKYCIVRTYSAGVFAGYIYSQVGKEVVLKRARRLWQWSGAASLSQLAMEGTSDPGNCKFPCEVDTIKLLEAIEILDVSSKAQKSINEVPIWAV